MERPLQAILISGEKCRDEVIARTKNTTIRYGFRDYVVGTRVMVCCPILNWCVSRTITESLHSFLKDLPVKYMQDNGSRDLTDTLFQLNRLYPGITENSQVTFVRWV